jgi:hypothetical protein
VLHRLGVEESQVIQLDLVEELARRPHFDGATYVAPLDHERLSKQLDRVREFMAPGAWHTLQEISDATGGDPQASVSARLRDLRKEKFGGLVVERRRRGEGRRGLFEYRLAIHP